MRLAENSVPKKNFLREESNGGGGLRFGEVMAEAERLLSVSAGKVLLLAEDALFAPLARSPRAISFIFDGDCLPLFSMPDGVSRVLAAGGGETLAAARCFAEVRGVPCTLFPTDGTLRGVFAQTAALSFGQRRTLVPLADGDTVCDLRLLKPTLARAYARLLLSRLAEIEGRALNAFGARLSVYVPSFSEGLSDEELLLRNAEGRRAERAGAYAGEGEILAGLLTEEPCPEWSAYLALSALYAAFFSKGKPRRYFTPDYRARAALAGGGPIEPPTAEEYALRAMALERMRAPFATETIALAKRREFEHAAVSARTEESLPAVGTVKGLCLLPEHAPHGLSAIIRDFGLLEWKDDKGRIAP